MCVWYIYVSVYSVYVCVHGISMYMYSIYMYVHAIFVCICIVYLCAWYICVYMYSIYVYMVYMYSVYVCCKHECWVTYVCFLVWLLCGCHGSELMHVHTCSPSILLTEPFPQVPLTLSVFEGIFSPSLNISPALLPLIIYLKYFWSLFFIKPIIWGHILSMGVRYRPDQYPVVNKACFKFC